MEPEPSLLCPKIIIPIAVLDLQEEENLSIVDEMSGPKVSFIQRLRCMLPDARRNPPLTPFHRQI